MPEITIGDVRLISDGRTLTIARDHPTSTAACFDSKGIEKLIDFVTALSETAVNRRRTFRVRLWKSSGLSVQIHDGIAEFSVTPRDISIAGVSVQLPADDRLNLELDSEVQVTLDLEGDVHSYRGIVRRREALECGLVFPESMQSEHIDPPPHLLRVVMELQRRFAARSVKHMR